MKRIDKLALQFNCDPRLDKKRAGQAGFVAGFLAARKMAAVMGQIAAIEKKSIEEEILKVGNEEVESMNLVTDSLPPGIIVDTLE
jgi:hypothetical protein